MPSLCCSDLVLSWKFENACVKIKRSNKPQCHVAVNTTATTAIYAKKQVPLICHSIHDKSPLFNSLSQLNLNVNVKKALNKVHVLL